MDIISPDEIKGSEVSEKIDYELFEELVPNHIYLLDLISAIISPGYCFTIEEIAEYITRENISRNDIEKALNVMRFFFQVEYCEDTKEYCPKNFPNTTENFFPFGQTIQKIIRKCMEGK